MPGNVKPSAIAVAFFAAYVVPTVVLFMIGGIGAANSDDGHYSPTWLSLLLVSSYVICPAGGGFLAARLAQQRAILHSVIVSILAAVALGLMEESWSLGSTLWWAGAFIPGGIAGAFLQRRFFSGWRAVT